VRLVTLHCGGESESTRELIETLYLRPSMLPGTIRKVQEAAIRINRRRIHALYQEKKKLSQLSQPALFQGGAGGKKEEHAEDPELDKAANAVIERETKIIKAIQQ
jgi:hypothetical protein